MIRKNKVSIVLFALVISSAKGATISTAVDEETCIDLCSSCDGIAEYEEGNCECNISASLDNEMECLGRMKRQAQEYGLDLVSCDSSTDARSTRCTLGHKHNYGKNDIEQVAKYFMQDGPMTGSIFIAPPYTHKTIPVTGKNAGEDCVVGAPSQGLITQPSARLPESIVSEPNLGSTLITQPKEFMPTVDVVPSSPTATINPQMIIPSGLTSTVSRTMLPSGLGQLDSLGLRHIAPQFLSFLGEVLTRPILGLPEAIQSVSRTPGFNQIVGAPANFLNSLADRMAENSKTAKENLDNFRQVVGKAREDAKADPKESSKAFKSKSSVPSYSLTNPHPLMSWLNPTVGSPLGQMLGAPTPTQFVSAPAPMQLLGGAFHAPLLSAAQLVSATVPNQVVDASASNQMVGASAPNCDNQMVGSPLSSIPPNQMVAATSPMLSAMPMIHSLGTIPLSSIVSQMAPTYLVGSPMAYYPAVQSTGTTEEHLNEAIPESLEEIPLSSPPRKKICKKANRDRSSTKFTRDVKFVEADNNDQLLVNIEEITTSTTELPTIRRTTTREPKQKPKDHKSVVGKIKPAGSKAKVEKKIVEHKL